MASPLPAADTQIDLGLETPWQVVLLDDDDHTYAYVIAMLMDLFGHPRDLAYQMACEVDRLKRVVVHVASREEALEKRREIQNYGPDPLLPRSSGSMSALAEPVL